MKEHVERTRRMREQSWMLDKIIEATGPDYCPGDDIIVPVKIKKKYLGKVVNEQYVTVLVGQKSAVVTHPNMKSIQFTFTVKSVNEVCS